MAAVASLRAALESERSSLQQIDASIKRIVQSHNDRQYNSDRFNNSSEGGRFNNSGDGGRFNSSGEGGRFNNSGDGGRLNSSGDGGRFNNSGEGRFNNFGDGGRFNHSGEGGRGLGGGVGGRYAARGGVELPEEASKRKHETKTVFSRLSARHDGDGDSDHEDGAVGKRPRISSQVTRDLPSKQEIMKAQCGDEQSKVRNRRMFGSLLGTLQKFKQEEIVLKSKEDKRAQVERRIEEQAVQEKEKQRRERQTLFADRELKKATIKALEAKLARVAEFDAWAAGQSTLGNFILTRTRPHIFWLPRKAHSATDERLTVSRQHHEKYMEKKRQELEEELIRIEQKCLRSAKGSHGAAHFAASKENKMADRQDGGEENSEEVPPRKRREKFVSEVRVKEENGTVVKMEEERDEEERRERRDSKDNADERRHRESGDPPVAPPAVREPEPVVEAEERNSKEQRSMREEGESKMEDVEMTPAEEQNGSRQASPTPEEPGKEGEESSADVGPETRQQSDESHSPAPVAAPAAPAITTPAPAATATGDSSD